MLTWHQGDDGIYATGADGRECGRMDRAGGCLLAYHGDEYLGMYGTPEAARRAVEAAHLRG